MHSPRMPRRKQWDEIDISFDAIERIDIGEHGTSRLVLELRRSIK